MVKAIPHWLFLNVIEPGPVFKQQERQRLTEPFRKEGELAHRFAAVFEYLLNPTVPEADLAGSA